MFAEKGEIIAIRNLHFKDNNRLDTRINGHPVLIIKKNDTHFYFLIISSSEPAEKYHDEHYAIKINIKNSPKSITSYINLTSIYKYELKNYEPIGNVSREKFYNIMLKFKKYQESHQADEFYPEVLDSIDDEIRKYIEYQESYQTDEFCSEVLDSINDKTRSRKK